MTDPKPNQIAVRARPKTRAKFTREDRAEFVRLIETGTARSDADAAAMLRISPHTVSRWLSLGGRTEQDWRKRLGPAEGTRAYAEHARFRRFYLDVTQARARASAIVDVVLVEAALGAQVEHVDPETGRRTIVREGGDWRAADAFGKRQERMDLHPTRRMMLAAQAEKERHAAEAARELARRAKADADRAELLAEATRKASKETLAAVVFTPTFLAALEAKRPDLHQALSGFMEETGYTVATPAQATHAARERDSGKDDEMLALAEAWGLDGLPETPKDDGPPDDPTVPTP